MASEAPKLTKDPMYQLLRVDNVKAFNIKKESGQTCDLINVNLRALDLRGLDADGLDLTNSYMRDADLRALIFPQQFYRLWRLRAKNFPAVVDI